MSYSALTELAHSPICPGCRKPILADDEILLVLRTRARIVRGYNEENEMPADMVTADMDWTEQLAYHVGCLDVRW